MKLSVPIPDIQNTRQAAQRLDPEIRGVIELLCDTVDALSQNQVAQTNTDDEDENEVKDENFDNKVFSIQDMIDNGLLKTYHKSSRKKTVGPYQRRN